MLRFARRLTSEGHAVVAALHDFLQVFRDTDHVTVMQDDGLISSDIPAAVAEPELLREAFSVDTESLTDPQSWTPMLVI